MTDNKLDIVFMGTPIFAAEILEELIKEFNIISVFTQMDKPKGRGKKLAASEVKEVALKHNLRLFQPKKLRDDIESINYLKESKADLIVVVAYGQILSKEVLDIPKLGCLNLHASLLPKYRGASPIQSVLLNGEEYTGNTVMMMNEGLDTGDMLKSSKIKINDEMNYGELHDLLMEDGKRLLIETIKELNENKIIRVKQNNNEASYSGKIEKKNEEIDFNFTARDIHNKVRAFNPIPLAFTTLNGKIIKIVETEFNMNENCKSIPGEIIKVEKNSLTVCCKNSTLKILKVQPQGKKVMDVRDFLNGNKIASKTILGK